LISSEDSKELIISMNLKLKIIEKFINEYKLQQSTYKEFGKTVYKIIKAILKNNEFRHQPVTYREKSINSLRKKIIKDKRYQELKTITEINDLVGCRIIFYVDRDIERFRNHIHKEFNVIKEELKYSPDEYNALHFVVKLNEDRLKLLEYAKYSNLKCEIQLTTALYYAWAEMNHDIIYKPPEELYNFDKQTFSLFKEKFSRVMKDHIKEAQYEFDFISNQLENIRKGKQVFDINFLNNIIHFKSNYELYENLTLLHKYIIEFGDKTPKELSIIKIIESALKKLKTLKIRPIKMTIGYLEDCTYTEVASVCLEILNDLKYLYIEEVFKLLIMLSLDQEPEVKKKSLEILARLSMYNLNVLKKIGYRPQLLILGKIEEWSTKQLIERIESFVIISEKLLEPSFERITIKDYETVAFQFGALKVENNLKKIRNRTIAILKKLYVIVEDRKQKQKIIQALQESTRMPDRGNYNKDMEKMVLDNTNELIDYYISIISNSDYAIIQDIEEDTYWLTQRLDTNKVPRIKELQSLISSIKEYDIFRTLVGYHYYETDVKKVEPEKIDFKEKEARRRNKIKEFVNDISENNFKDWERIILSIIKNYSFPEDQGEFWHFNLFLKELGEQKPEIAYRLLINNEEKLEPFITHLIDGIWKSDLKQLAKELISKWINEGKHLSQCALVFYYVGEIDKPLINKIFNQAIKIKDKDIQNNTFNNIIQSIVTNYPKHKNTKNLFISSIKELTKNKNWNWIYNEWYSRDSILKSLTNTQVDAILKNLLHLPDIKSLAEEALTQIAEDYPLKVIKFFYERYLIQKNEKREGYYDAIPYKLHQMSKPLSENEEIIIPEILKWFKKKDPSLHREGSRLIEAIFPAFNKILEEKLIKLIKSKNKKNIRIVFNILHAYKGEEFLHNICKELIKEYPENDDYQREIFFILSQMREVSGEYGFVEGLKKKKEEIQSWKVDDNKVIQVFVKKYEDHLRKRIINEKKQADENIELRKRRFDS
jgi:ppGpp synthetase/RelA/SpoT-type nucleotidyltranferase